MLTLYLIRHPKTQGRTDIIKGHENVPLEPRWEPKVDKLAKKILSFSPIDAVFTSDLDRARLPAERIVKYLKGEQTKTFSFVVDKLFRERDVGIYKRKKFEEFNAKIHPYDYIFEKDAIPDGESKNQIYKRIKLVNDKYLNGYIKNGGNIIVVGHGWWINYYRNYMLKDHSKPYNNIPNLGVLVLQIDRNIANEIPFN